MNSLKVENIDGRYHELHHNEGRTREVLLIEGQIGEGWKVVKVKVELEVVKVEFAVEWLVVV